MKLSIRINPIAKAVRTPAFRSRIVTSKKVKENRKPVRQILIQEIWR